MRVELLGTFLSLFIGISLVQRIKTIDAGLAGIALTFSTSLLEYVYWLMRQSTTVDMHFEAVERINEYMEMPQEPPSIVEGSRPPAAVSVMRCDLYTVHVLIQKVAIITVAYQCCSASQRSDA